MNFKELEIPSIVVDFFRDNQESIQELESCNDFLKKICGIAIFFENTEQLCQFLSLISAKGNLVEEPSRREYGDFQTNQKLALNSVEYILSKTNQKSYDFVLEPTCGKGNFILAALSKIPDLKKIVGVEIYQPYVWETKFKVLEHFVKHMKRNKPEIEIIHANVFDFDFESLSRETKQLKTLVIGNPPWVTNSELGSINSKNLPQKSNFKKHNGFDAITGKGNFDIGEYIALLMLKNFSSHSGKFGFLIKNSVVKNLVFDQYHNRFTVGNIKTLNIDAKKEFNVSVDACLFLSEFNQKPELFCKKLDFYTHKERTIYGWTNDKFVYSIDDYREANDIDGKSQFVWRQGIKHDCSKIMEIEIYNGHFKNGLNQEVEIEHDLVYGLLKSSDLKETQTNSYRKLTIVTQQKIGQETNYIKKDYPLTYNYLKTNKSHFDKRKSSIYNGKPDFSIFGVGPYSFMPYKVGISGMYKSTHFTLVLPKNNKPIMLDDTCYFIGFETLKKAQIAHYLLNHEHTQQFLKSIIFPDSKRSITKDVLMRIDFYKLYQLFDYNLIQEKLKIKKDEWKEFGALIEPKVESKQMTLF